jgi:hypothetical protein
VRLDHLLSRVSEHDPTTDRCFIMPFAVKGDGLIANVRFLSLLSCQGGGPGLVAQLVRAQS